MLVVKIGGAAGNNMDAVCADLAQLIRSGQRAVLVHGGSEETNAVSEKLGHPPKFVTSPSGFTSRYTDRETLEIFAMVTAGKINILLVERLQRLGVNAFGLSGVDGRAMQAKRKEAVRSVENGRVRMLHGDHTGTIEKVDAALLQTLIQSGLTLVVAPLAISPEGVALNVDADRAAAMIAGALKAESLVILTNVPGLMRKFPDQSTLLPKIERAGLEDALKYAEGRMKKKVLGASEALGEGVRRVIFADSRIPRPVTAALAGKGTVIT
ncbi:MAG: [LysW]-aminoadipate kinase [Anaerolineales bacterium]|nr:[LysW]-aminoadipate kinase [Anaerolineales bacterium]